MVRKYWYAIFLSASVLSGAPSGPTYVTDGTNNTPPGTVYLIDGNTATQLIANDLSPSFIQPVGVAISPDGSFAYVADWGASSIFYVDTATNSISKTVESLTTPYFLPNGVAISSDGTFGYVADYGNQTVYYVDVATNSATQNVTNTFAGFNGPAVTAISYDGSFAYVTDLRVGGTPGAVYRIDTASNTVSNVVSGPFGFPIGVAISPDGSRAYVTDSEIQAVFSIDTKTNVATQLAFSSFVAPYGVAISPDGSTAYIADPGAQSVFYVDTNSNEVVQQVEFDCSFPNWAVNTIAISPDGKSLYVTGGNAANIWHIDIASGTPTQLSNSTGFSFLSPTSLGTPFPWIPVASLSGNNLTLANYFNENAPYSVVRNFVPLHGSDLNEALESASPSRNALLTYATQTTQIALGRLVYDHLRQDRWRRSVAPPSLLVDAGKFPSQPSKRKKNFSVWAGAFGAYAHEHAQDQTPAFSADSGGVVAAFDYSGIYPHPFGAGLSYAHTHLNEAGGAGSANIDQGDLFVYGTIPVSQWYFDFAFWGGYYHAKNIRNITLPNLTGKATLKTHGWQFTPHLEVGYDYRSDWFGLEPFTLCDWVNCWEHGANESGSPTLNMGQSGRYCSLLRSETGLRFEEILAYSWGTFTFTEQGSYAYQKTFHTGKIHAFLIGSPGSFTVETLTGAQNLGVAEVEVLFVPTNSWPYASLSYHFEAGSGYQAHQGMLEMGANF